MAFRIPDITYPLSVGTIGMMLATGAELSIHCNAFGCGHHASINLVMLARRLGMDHSCMDPDIRRYFHCSACRAAGRPGTDFQFIHHQLAEPHSRWPAAPHVDMWELARRNVRPV